MMKEAGVVWGAIDRVVTMSTTTYSSSDKDASCAGLTMRNFLVPQRHPFLLHKNGRFSQRHYHPPPPYPMRAPIEQCERVVRWR